MADRAEPFKFTVNVPVPCEIRFVDIRPGKLWTDPKGVTKKLPAQVSVKGKFGGLDTICYLPGPAWKNVKALTDGGIIAGVAAAEALVAANNEELESPHAVSVAEGKATITLSKAAGEKYESLIVDTGAVKPQGPGRVDSPYAEPKKKVQPFDEEHFPSEEYGESVADPLPPVPEWVEEKPKADTGTAYKRKQIADGYLGLLKYVIEHSKLTDQQAIQAATATIWISYKDGGVRPGV